jgi:aminoglycoside phosphotransferase (APT) family kinase protein
MSAVNAWVAGTIGPGSRVLGRRRLFGGVSADVHLVLVEDGNGRRHRVVLKSYPHPGPKSPAPWVVREVESLEAIATTKVPGPKIIAADPHGEFTGGLSALLMTRVPGRVHLAPRAPEDWLRQMARQLAEIHAVSLPAPAFDRWRTSTDVRVPERTRNRAVWERAIEIMGRPEPSFDPTFIHRDYQHFNMLWTRERLASIVDWASYCLGPPDIDVGHCRLNLAVLFSAEWAETFRLAYEAESGRQVDPWWDLFELLLYADDWPTLIPRQVAGRAPVDGDGMTDRVEELIAIVLRRL